MRQFHKAYRTNPTACKITQLFRANDTLQAQAVIANHRATKHSLKRRKDREVKNLV
jgi:hypothetical protein